MLNATKLKELLGAAKAGVPAIGKTIRVVSDNDVADFTRDIKLTDNQVVLVGVLPSFGLDFQNIDNFRHGNKMLFFMVKKFDTRKGNEAFMDVYDETGAAVLAFEEWLFEQSQKFPCPAIFKDIDFKSFNVDPVRDYHALYGYMISFDLKTR